MVIAAECPCCGHGGAAGLEALAPALSCAVQALGRPRACRAPRSPARCRALLRLGTKAARSEASERATKQVLSMWRRAQSSPESAGSVGTYPRARAARPAIPRPPRAPPRPAEARAARARRGGRARAGAAPREAACGDFGFGARLLLSRGFGRGAATVSGPRRAHTFGFAPSAPALTWQRDRSAMEPGGESETLHCVVQPRRRGRPNQGVQWRAGRARRPVQGGGPRAFGCGEQHAWQAMPEGRGPNRGKCVCVCACALGCHFLLTNRGRRLLLRLCCACRVRSRAAAPPPARRRHLSHPLKAAPLAGRGRLSRPRLQRRQRCRAFRRTL